MAFGCFWFPLNLRARPKRARYKKGARKTKAPMSHKANYSPLTQSICVVTTLNDCRISSARV